jgi:uncharacterized integral membrane protein
MGEDRNDNEKNDMNVWQIIIGGGLVLLLVVISAVYFMFQSPLS